MGKDERSIDDLIRISEGISRTKGFSAGMDDIRGTARGDGISLSVDVQGKLVELKLDEKVLALGPYRLAAEISRLSGEAGARSLRQGMSAIETECNAKAAAALGEYVSIDEEPARPAPMPEPPRPTPEPPPQPAQEKEEPARPTPKRAPRPSWDDDEPEEGSRMMDSLSSPHRDPWRSNQ